MNTLRILVLITSFVFMTNIVTAQTTTPIPVPVLALPPEIQALTSKAELGAYLAVSAREVEITVDSIAQVGNSIASILKLNGPATTNAINTALKNLKMQIQLSNTDADVYYSVHVRNADNNLSLVGNDRKRPVSVKGGYSLPTFEITLRFTQTALILAKNVNQVKFSLTDHGGKVTGYHFLNITPSGFLFPTNAVGKGILEIRYQDGSTTTYDLRKGSRVIVETINATAVAAKENVESVTDKNEINLIPFTKSGIGENVLGEIELSKNINISAAGMTSEGAKATGFKYRQIAPEVTSWNLVKASNGIAVLPLTQGKWQVLPIWDSSSLQEPLYPGPEKG